MNTKVKQFCLASVCYAITVVGVANAQPQAEHNHTDASPKQTLGPHGGLLQAVGTMQLETIVAQSGIQIFIYNESGQPIDVSTARGLATLKLAGDSKQHRYDLFADTAKDKPTASLSAAVDLSRIAGHEVQINLQIVGIPKTGRKGLVLTELATVPLTKKQTIAAAVAAQKVCPVSGQPLKGTPLSAQIGDQTIYVCCESCIKTLKANPAKYLGKPSPQASNNKPAVYKVTKEDTRFIAAQKICPVMDEPLDGMGGPCKTVVSGKIVYLCCPGCAKKLHARPDVYLAKLAKQGVHPPEVAR